MAQYRWTYVSDSGRRYQVGLFHGLRNGHLLIYCNAKVLMVDFKVFQSETYPFFIEDELCEIQVTRQKNQFQYNFNINQEADTPRNRVRKKVNRKYSRQTLTFFLTLLAAVIIFAAFAIRYDGKLQTSREQAMISQSSRIAKGTILRFGPGKKNTTLTYEFSADNRIYKGTQEIPTDSIPQLFPIRPGDEFFVLYVWYSPGINKIQLKYPSEAQIQRYFEQTVDLHQSLHPNLSQTQTVCLIDLAYELQGLPGLANFFNQNRKPTENEQFNEQTYQKLIRDLPFDKKRKERCW